MKTINKKYLILSMFCFGMLTACTKPNSSEEIQNNSFTNNSNNSTVINLSNEITSDVYGTSSSSSSSSSANTNFEGWDVDLSLRGTAFRDKLATLINQKGRSTCSYDATLGIGARAAEINNSGKFIPFYHSADQTNTFGSVKSPSSSCNREHTWPNSRGAGKSGPGSDPFIIRPTLSSENSDRSNYFYGLNGKSNREWDPASCGFQGARGESARVIFYAATRYAGGNYKFRLTNTPYDSNNSNTMGRLDRLYEWNKLYPVTDNERQINNYLESQGYGRNPFVDYPELVDYIWDANGFVASQANYYFNTGLSYHALVNKCTYLDNIFKLY